MHNTVNFLKTRGVEAMTQELGIIVKRHPAYPHLVFFKYNQVESPMNHPVVQECRGLMLDESNDWMAVSYPFNKFFNYGEGNAADIDWSTARVYEKLDGSLMTMYYYDGVWQVASNGTPDAGGPVEGGAETFADLWWSTFNIPLDRLEPCFCYMFELMTPKNRVIVPHATPRFALLGMRDMETLEEVDHINWAQEAGMPVAPSFSLSGWDSIVEAAKGLNPMQSEGFVVCDGRFNRVKVKCPQYVALAHMKDGFSRRRMIELVRHGEGDEFLGYFPEYRALYEEIVSRHRTLADRIESRFAEIRGIESQKDFALLATKEPCPAALFTMRKTGVSAGQWLRDANLAAIERYFEP